MQKESQSTKSILDVQIMGIDSKPRFIVRYSHNPCPCSYYGKLEITSKSSINKRAFKKKALLSGWLTGFEPATS